MIGGGHGEDEERLWRGEEEEDREEVKEEENNGQTCTQLVHILGEVLTVHALHHLLQHLLHLAYEWGHHLPQLAQGLGEGPGHYGLGCLVHGRQHHHMLDTHTEGEGGGEGGSGGGRILNRLLLLLLFHKTDFHFYK